MEHLKKPSQKSCKDCDALCCTSFSISTLHKEEGVPCTHLDECNNCKIYPHKNESDQRPNICAKYDCAGAGTHITQLFKEYNLEKNPLLQEVRDLAFSTLQSQSALINQMQKMLLNTSAQTKRQYLEEKLDLLFSIRKQYTLQLKNLLNTKGINLTPKDINNISGEHLSKIYYEGSAIISEYPRL